MTPSNASKRKRVRRGSRRHFAKHRAKLSEDQGGLCIWCDEAMRGESSSGQTYPPLMATIDHIIPRAGGGTNVRANLVAACNGCNNRRGDMPAGAFAMLTKGLRFVGAGFFVEALLCQ